MTDMPIVSKLFDTSELASFLTLESFAILAEVVVLLWLGKLVRGWLTRGYELDRMLTTHDNKAVAVSFAGYIVGLGIVLFRVATTPSPDFLVGLRDVAIWGAIGIVLLNLATWVNQKLVLRRFDSGRQIAEKGNVGAALVECGASVGTGFVVGACVGGESAGWVEGLVGTAIFFVLGQAALVLWAAAYQKVVRYDVQDLLANDNVAAGVAFGMTLASFGIVISHPIAKSFSLALFGVWLVVGMVALTVIRLLVDWLLLPHHKLDREIAEDRNWGVGLIEGGMALMVAFLLKGSF